MVARGVKDVIDGDEEQNHFASSSEDLKQLFLREIDLIKLLMNYRQDLIRNIKRKEKLCTNEHEDTITKKQLLNKC